MASYNELNALIDAYINRNGVQAITGQILNGVLKAMVEQLGRGYTIMGAATPTTDPGTPDGPECWFASETGTYTDFDGLQVVPGELALLCYTPTDGWTKATIYEGFQEVEATIDGNVGTPSVGVSYADGVLSFDFRNLKGNTGDPAGFGTIAATVDGNIGTPGVSVQSSGPDTAKNITFQFTNLKGETGVTSVVATVDNTVGTPTCTVSLVGQQLTLAFSGLKGAQGDTGSSVDYPFTIVNNLTTNDATQALSAAQGVVLQGELSQLEAKVIDLYQDLTDGITYTTDVNVGSTVSTTPNTNLGWKAGIFDCEAGDTFYFNAKGGSGARLWCFTDVNYKCLSNAPAGNRNETVTAPTNAKHLFVNVNDSYTPKTVQKIIKRIDKLEEDVASLETKTNAIQAEIDGIKETTVNMYTSLEDGKTYATSGAIGTVVSLTPSTNPGWKSGIFDCEEGEKFYFNANGGNGARCWCFIDSDNKILSNADAGRYTGNATAPENTAKLIVNINPTYPPSTFVRIENRFDVIDERLSDLETEQETIDGEIGSLNIELGNTMELVQPITDAADVIRFPYVAKAGDVLHIEVSASGVISSSPDDYEPIYAEMTYLDTIWDGASIDVTLPIDCTYLRIVGRGPAFIAPGNITLEVTNKNSIKGRIETLEARIPTPEIILPNKLTAIVGHQFNIYYDSILLASNNEDYQKQWAGQFPANDQALACGLRFSPTATQTAKNISLTLSDKVSGVQIVKKTVPVKVIADTEVTGKKVIFIGDSLTDAGYYPAEIQHNLSGGGITSLGTRSDSVTINGQVLSINHEGRSGWSSQDYVTKSTYNGMANAFWNPNTSAFDFSYYMTQQGYSGVDIVCLCLGTNGGGDLENAIAALDEMIESIHTYDSNIIVLVTMITPPAEQDGFGYTTAYTSADASYRGKVVYNKRILAEYGNRNDNVDIVPWYINVNRKYDFPTTEQAFSSRNPTLVTRQTDNVHPSVYGYLAMADAMYCVLLDKLTS